MTSYYQSRGSFRKAKAHEDVDPMTSMGNIGDIMLVFACGLMVALVVAWNVDLAQFQQVDMDQELDQDEVTEMNNELYGEGNAFVEMGKVYQDPTTGKYYLVEDGTSSSQGSSGVSTNSTNGTSGTDGTSGTSGTSSTNSTSGTNGSSTNNTNGTNTSTNNGTATNTNSSDGSTTPRSADASTSVNQDATGGQGDADRLDSGGA